MNFCLQNCFFVPILKENNDYGDNIHDIDQIWINYSTSFGSHRSTVNYNKIHQNINKMF